MTITAHALQFMAHTAPTHTGCDAQDAQAAHKRVCGEHGTHAHAPHARRPWHLALCTGAPHVQPACTTPKTVPHLRALLNVDGELLQAKHPVNLQHQRLHVCRALE